MLQFRWSNLLETSTNALWLPFPNNVSFEHDLSGIYTAIFILIVISFDWCLLWVCCFKFWIYLTIWSERLFLQSIYPCWSVFSCSFRSLLDRRQFAAPLNLYLFFEIRHFYIGFIFLSQWILFQPFVWWFLPPNDCFMLEVLWLVFREFSSVLRS